MPHYYFHLNDGHEDQDVDGLDLPNLEAARIMAVRFAGEILLERTERFTPGADWRVNVADLTGAILLTVDLALSQSAAIGRPIPGH